jgi:uncharacterized protein YbbC (DUF1343 family)
MKATLALPVPLLAALLFPLLAACAPGSAGTPGPASVRPGLEVLLADPPAAVRGRRVGLITNHTAIDRAGTSAIDLLHASEALELVALFSPEHGIRGAAADGEIVASGVDARTGLPIHSLYGETRRPTPAMLAGIEALLFDIQDIGARQYTYISTMAHAMEAAAAAGIPFVVLDRPNPIGGEIVEGGVLDPAFRTFVGVHPIAGRHGMTVGELARLFDAEFGIGADLVVVPVEGWRREQWLDQTGLPWVNPSPNIRRLEAAAHYPGTVFLEGTNLLERGTDLPFEQTGAPWLDAEGVAAEMNALGLAGVRFDPVRLAVEPTARKFPGQTVPGVRLVATDRNAYRPVRAVLLLIDAVRRRHPAELEWTATIDRLAGTDRLRRAIEAGTLPALLEEWDRDAERFRALREPYLLYP